MTRRRGREEVRRTAHRLRLAGHFHGLSQAVEGVRMTSLLESTQSESIEDFMVRAIPPGWEEWEWMRFMASCGRLFLLRASEQFELPVPELIRILTNPIPMEN